MKDIREEAADLLGDQIAEIEEQKHEKEMARLERKERQRIKERNKWIERMVAPLLFLVTLVISALVMLFF
jgi:cell division septal protein FtsQ